MRRLRLVLVALLVAALLPAAADARPDGPSAQTAMKTVKKTKAKSCKKKKSRAAKRRCLKRKRRAAARKTPAAQAPGAPAPSGGATAPGSTAPASPTPAPTEDPYGHEVPDLPPSNPRALQVISGEFFLNLSKAQVSSGDVRVEFNNAYAEDPHDLHLVKKSGDADSYAFGELQSGEVEAKTLKLSTGTWQLFCAFPEHMERGMSANLKVVQG